MKKFVSTLALSALMMAGTMVVAQSSSVGAGKENQQGMQQNGTGNVANCNNMHDGSTKAKPKHRHHKKAAANANTDAGNSTTMSGSSSGTMGGSNSGTMNSGNTQR